MTAPFVSIIVSFRVEGCGICLSPCGNVMARVSLYVDRVGTACKCSFQEPFLLVAASRPFPLIRCVLSE